MPVKMSKREETLTTNAAYIVVARCQQKPEEATGYIELELGATRWTLGIGPAYKSSSCS